MKNNIFSKLTNYEKIHLALSVILGILYTVVRNIKTNIYIILLFLTVLIIILLILTYVFAYKSSVAFLRSLWYDYAKNGDVVCGYFAIVYMSLISLFVVFIIMQIVNEQTKELMIMIRDIIIAITPACIALLKVHYKENFPKNKEKKATVVIHRSKGGCNNGKQICKKSCLRCYRKIRGR